MIPACCYPELVFTFAIYSLRFWQVHLHSRTTQESRQEDSSPTTDRTHRPTTAPTTPPTIPNHRPPLLVRRRHQPPNSIQELVDQTTQPHGSKGRPDTRRRGCMLSTHLGPPEGDEARLQTHNPHQVTSEATSKGPSPQPRSHPRHRPTPTATHQGKTQTRSTSSGGPKFAM